VVKSLWNSGDTSDVIFLADYAINPLGVTSGPDITDVADRWLKQANKYSDTLVMACNTLSVQYDQLLRSEAPEILSRAGFHRLVTEHQALPVQISKRKRKLK